MPPAAPAFSFRSAARLLFWILTAFALPACALTTAAYFASSPALFAQLSPFRVQYAVLLAAHVLFCLVSRRPRWAVVFAAFALFNLRAVLRPAPLYASSPSRPASPSVRILLANVLTSNRDPSRLLALIANEQPALVALLEIDARWQAELATDPALSAAYPHVRFHPREDNFGLALLSRHPLSETRAEFFVDPELPSFAFTFVPAADSRPLRVLLTHPFPPGDSIGAALRDQQLREIGAWAGSVSPALPKIILGDLNATPWCPALRRLLASAGLRPAARDVTPFFATWPAPIPFLRIPIDHALLDDALVCTAYRTGPDIGSDHLPLVLDIAPRPSR